MADETTTTTTTAKPVVFPELKEIPLGELTIADITTQPILQTLIPDGIKGAVSIHADLRQVLLLSAQGVYVSPYDKLTKTTWLELAQVSKVADMIAKAVSAGTIDLSDYLKTADANAKFMTQANLDSLSTAIDTSLKDYLKTADFGAKVADSLTPYAKTADVDTKDAASVKSANTYTDTKIGDLVNSAPEALDTLGEIAKILTANEASINDILTAIGKKADTANVYTKADIDGKITDVNNAVKTVAWNTTNDVTTHIATPLPLGVGKVGKFLQQDDFAIYRPDDQLNATLYFQKGAWVVDGTLNI